VNSRLLTMFAGFLCNQNIYICVAADSPVSSLVLSPSMRDRRDKNGPKHPALTKSFDDHFPPDVAIYIFVSVRLGVGLHKAGVRVLMEEL
jgi:hypothetical protein